jgi:hypothetical protein
LNGLGNGKSQWTGKRLSKWAVDCTETPNAARLPHRGIPLLWSLAAFAPAGPSCRRGRRSQPGDQHQRRGEHLSRHRDLGQLERDVATVANDLRADLDALLGQAAQRPGLRCLWCASVRMKFKVMGQYMKLEKRAVGDEGPA